MAKICGRSFLSFWCYVTPRAPNGNELCDLLVVCDPYLIIISVKEMALNPNKEPSVAHARWERKAVEDSIRQIYGAEKMLATMTNVIRRDGTLGLKLPVLADRTVHRIAVAFGDNDQAITRSGDRGKGYVRVMGAQSFTDILTELDTIRDLMGYLAAKETMSGAICEGSEANMVAWYLLHDRVFPTGAMMVFDNTLWAGLKTNPAFQRRKQADEVSYAWDNLIETMSDSTLVTVEGPKSSLTDLDLALRAMACEMRFYRRMLGQQFVAFLHDAQARKLRSRLLHSPSGVTYVFVYFGSAESSRDRQAEMLGRCYVARKRVGKGEVVVGIGLSPHEPGIGWKSDLTYVRFPRWSEVELKQAEEYERLTGHFSGTAVHQKSDEYPG